MGEIADMMLDGTLCQCCGDYLGTEAGYPVYCNSCEPSKPRAPIRKEHNHFIKYNKKQREQNLREAHTFGFDTTNGSHFWVWISGSRFDYWPSTHKFRYRGLTEQGDVDKKLKELGVNRTQLQT